MNFYETTYIILTLAVMVGYVNYRFIKMPMTIAIMFSSLLLSLGLIAFGELAHKPFAAHIDTVLSSIDFHDILMNGMLSFLLFAGGLSVDIHDLRKRKWEVGILASIGTIVSAILVGLGAYYLLHLFSMDIDFIYCMLFGALISPTDPIAVLALFKELKAPRDMSIFLEGESLFNDGVGIVIFLTLYELAFNGHSLSLQAVSVLFLRQAIGGIIYGYLIGKLAFFLMKPVNNHRLEILLSITVATGGYAVAELLDISGPLAMVVAGIILGNAIRGSESMSAHSRDALALFWEVIDEVLNAFLFLLIGFELLVIDLNIWQLLVGLLAIPMVLFIRFICVATPMAFFKKRKQYYPHITKILVWGGLRGGLAVALALALPNGPYRNLILSMTYAVVVFAILVQGMTMKPLISLALRLSEPKSQES